MYQKIEKSFFDWSREKTPRVQSRGIAAIIPHQVRSGNNSELTHSTRCVWPSAISKGDTRYLSRRVWMS